MGFKRFVAATTRDAMRQVRQDLGDEAVILSSRKIAGGHFEILAAAADAVEAIVEDARKPRAAAPTPTAQRPAARVGGVETFQEYLKRQGQQRSVAPAAAAAAAARPSVATRTPNPAAAMYEDVANASAQDVQQAADQWWDAPASLAEPGRAASVAAPVAPAICPRVPARTTVVAPVEPAVFRRRPTRVLQEQIAGASPARSQAVGTAMPPAPVTPLSPAISQQAVAATSPHAAATPVVQPMPAAPAASARSSLDPVAVTPRVPPQAVALTDIQVPQPPQPGDQQLMAELQSLRAALQDQLNAISSTVAADSLRRDPLMARLMTRLLTAGFSAEVARRVAQHAPADLQLETSQEWLQSVIAMNLRCTDTTSSLVDRAGVFALVGPTGVGKTTTVAKLAARFAVKYGTNALGLITLDAYRVAAHEQLRAYGRILGTPVHLAQDGATLRELLSSMRGKRLVLIDTCGVGPRDERLNEMLAMLAEAGRDAQRVQPVLLLNAGSHTETLDETARAWRAPQAAGCILTKLDEAARVGGALDCALRYKLTLLGLTNGQRVPEDLHLPNAKLLAHLALKPGGQAFALAESEATALAVAH
jgi:flagellar biosynthesis protein FlhF